MMKVHRRLLLAASLAAILLPVSAAAKGSFTMATVSGPDWFGEIEITDPEVMAKLDMVAFMDMNHPIASPELLSVGYLLTRGYDDQGKFLPYDRIVVFPAAPGYVYYLETVNGSGSMDGRWYRMTGTGQAALLGELEAQGVRLSSWRAPAELSAPAADPAQWAIPLLTTVVGLAAGWILGRGQLDRLAARAA